VSLAFNRWGAVVVPIGAAGISRASAVVLADRVEGQL
jgi:hypothetical protein